MRGIMIILSIASLAVATAAAAKVLIGIFRQTIAPGSGPPDHMHMMEVEFVYVVNGDFEFKLTDRVQRVPVGTFMFIPRMTAHTFKPRSRRSSSTTITSATMKA